TMFFIMGGIISVVSFVIAYWLIRKILKFINKKYVPKIANLKFLSLQHNQLIEVPEKIGNLKLVENIKLGNNELTVLPNSLGKLANLEFLSITNNPISSLPETLKNLKNLEHVYVRGTQITEKPEIFKDARFIEDTGTIYMKGIIK
ncbi:MAG: leucine-rich repeat domain-containing protein, partial [Promethearchaeota archaeon]